MATMLSVGLWAAVLACAYGWGNYGNYDSPARRSYEENEPCVGSGSKCYASDQCCRGFVCAAFDDLFGLNPEVPGFCVREKDLHPCTHNMDCADGSKCMGLGRGGEKYCVVMPDDGGEGKPAPPPVGKANKYRYPTTKGSLGDTCNSSTECSEKTTDGQDNLCCQKIKRYRQKSRTICDRVTPISSCLP